MLRLNLCFSLRGRDESCGPWREICGAAGRVARGLKRSVLVLRISASITGGANSREGSMFFWFFTISRPNARAGRGGREKCRVPVVGKRRRTR